MWRETTLLTDRAVHFATAKTNVFSDSVLCLGGISDEPVKAWESKIKKVHGITLSCRTNWIGSTGRADGARVDKFPRIHHFGNSRRDSKDDDWIKCEPEQFKGMIIFMSMYNDIDWTKRGSKEHSLCCDCSQSYAWIREEMVRNPCRQTGWRME